MKKLVALVLALVLLCSTAIAAEIDLSGMSLAELLELQQRVTMAMWETEEWQEVEVPSGVYEVGKDIPAGHWTITPVDGGYTVVQWGKKLDESGLDFGGGDAYERKMLTSESYKYFAPSDTPSVSWNLMEGSFITIDGASVIFTPFAGHNLGFK